VVADCTCKVKVRHATLTSRIQQHRWYQPGRGKLHATWWVAVRQTFFASTASGVWIFLLCAFPSSIQSACRLLKVFFFLRRPFIIALGLLSFHLSDDEFSQYSIVHVVGLSRSGCTIPQGTSQARMCCPFETPKTHKHTELFFLHTPADARLCSGQEMHSLQCQHVIPSYTCFFATAPSCYQDMALN
jgi:hypothetical protein